MTNRIKDWISQKIINFSWFESYYKIIIQAYKDYIETCLWVGDSILNNDFIGGIIYDDDKNIFSDDLSDVGDYITTISKMCEYLKDNDVNE